MAGDIGKIGAWRIVARRIGAWSGGTWSGHLGKPWGRVGPQL
jgi:hypothetical protein